MTSIKKNINNDPLAPKKPLSVYFFFAAAIRDEMKNQYPEADDFQRAKIIAERWTSTPESGRLAYYLLHKESVEKYHEDLLKYLDKNYTFVRKETSLCVDERKNNLLKIENYDTKC